MTEAWVYVPLSKGAVTVVDFDDWQDIKGRGPLYADTGKHISYACIRQQRLHRVILRARPWEEVDHKDGDGLNNRRSNIRLCSRKQNLRNIHRRGKPQDYSSPYRGVKRNQTAVNSWHAGICCDGKQHYLGAFKTEIEAARAYDEAAARMFGEFANLNFPNKKEA